MDPRQVARDYERALEKTPSEIDLDNVGRRVGGDSSFLVHLGVPVDKIKPLSKEYRNPVDACFFGLVYWRDGNIRNKALTWSVLLEALEEGGERKGYARELREDIVDITNRAEQRQQSVEDDSPTLEGILCDTDLNAISKEVNGDWRSFLTHLGVRATEIRSLREKHGPDPAKICLHGLVFWREGNHPCRPPTWPVLCEALEKGAEKREYARKLEEDIASRTGPGVECAQGPPSLPPQIRTTVDERSKTACQDELKSKIISYIQAVHDLVRHRDMGIEYLRKAADDLDAFFKKFATVKNIGNVVRLVGGACGVVGGGLLLGGVMTPTAVCLLAVSSALRFCGGFVGAGAKCCEVINNIVNLQWINNWVCQDSKLCTDLIEKYQEYCGLLERICQQNNSSEETAIQTALRSGGGRCHVKIDEAVFRTVDRQIRFAIFDCRTNLELGANLTSTAVGGGSFLAVAQKIFTGAETGSETGKVVARTAFDFTGKVSVASSVVFMIVDLALLFKTTSDLNKIKKGCELANKLRQVVDDMEVETARLRPLANFTNQLH